MPTPAPPKRDKIYAVYFILHTFISLLIDSWIALPRYWLFDWQNQLADFHIKSNNDLLFAARPIWLQTFVWVELIFQVPFFVWAAYDLLKGNKRIWPAALVYGVEAATTTLGCLSEVCALDLPQGEKFSLFMVYFPTFLIPLVIVVDFWGRIVSSLEKQKLE